MITLDGGRIGIAAQALGIAQVCHDLAAFVVLQWCASIFSCLVLMLALVLQASLEASVDYANQREAFGKPIAKLQAIQVHRKELKRREQISMLFSCSKRTLLIGAHLKIKCTRDKKV